MPRVSRRRPALIALVVIGASVCLLLAWWQWTRYESAGGSGQNLGYAMQWPAFALCLIYAYRRFVRLETDPATAQKVAAAAPQSQIPDDLLPTRPQSHTEVDAETAEYNRYLADLAAADHTPQASSQTGQQ